MPSDDAISTRKVVSENTEERPEHTSTKIGADLENTVTFDPAIKSEMSVEHVLGPLKTMEQPNYNNAEKEVSLRFFNKELIRNDQILPFRVRIIPLAVK